MIRKALLLGIVSIGLAGIATACVTTTTSGGGGTGGIAGSGAAGTAGSGTGGSAGTAGSGAGGAAGTAGSGAGGTAGTAGSGAGGTAGSGTGGTAGSDGGVSVQLPAGCVTDSTVQVTCNPVTNEGCNTAGGEACDLGSDSQGNENIGCFPPPNTQKLGDTCALSGNGPFCEGKLHCDIPQAADGGTGAADGGTPTGTCKQYCCSNSDCNGGTCTPFNAALGTLGVCN